MNIKFAILLFAFIIISVYFSIALADQIQTDYGVKSVAQWLGSAKIETIKDRLLNEIIVVQSIQNDLNRHKIVEEDQRLQLKPREPRPLSAYAAKEAALLKIYNCMNTTIGFVDEKELFEYCFFKGLPQKAIDEFKNNNEFGKNIRFIEVMKDIYNLALNEQKRENKK